MTGAARPRPVAGLLLALAVLAAFAAMLLAGSARAGAANPWHYRMANPDTAQPGMVVHANGGANGQVFEVRDHAGQPIFAVNKAGGVAVLGDAFRVMDGSDPYRGQVTVSPYPPDPAVCVRDGQLWIGGPAGGLWRCTTAPGPAAPAWVRTGW